MGDEVRRTQRGNNNAYCQDNEISWFDWDLVEKHAGLHRFVKLLIAIRLNRDVSQEDPELSLNEFLQTKKVKWHGIKLNHPDWAPHSHSIACTVWTHNNTFVLHFMFNAYHQNLDFELPSVKDFGGKNWRRLIDTSLEAPEDVNRYTDASLVNGKSYSVSARSMAVMIEAIT